MYLTHICNSRTKKHALVRNNRSVILYQILYTYQVYIFCNHNTVTMPEHAGSGLISHRYCREELDIELVLSMLQMLKVGSSILASCIKAIWRGHKLLSKWERTFHLKAVPQFAKRPVIVSDRDSNSDPRLCYFKTICVWGWVDTSIVSMVLQWSDGLHCIRFTKSLQGWSNVHFIDRFPVN